MQKTKTCRECGAPVPPDAPFGHCPKCLVSHGFGPLPDGLLKSLGVVGDYQLLVVIGHGGMGMVYKARQLSLNRLVAIKMLNRQSAAFPRVAERLRFEAETAASLSHPGIVTIHEVNEIDGQPYFVMELIDGIGLDRLIGKMGYEPLSSANRAGPSGSERERQETCARVLLSVVRAVAYAHQHGVLHRDLKPANILIDQQGDPHLTDFGLAKVAGRKNGRETEHGSVLGTPAYMAPEQAAGDIARMSTAADIYSLGAVLYEMLTGRAPFCGKSQLDTLRLVTNQDVQHPRACNPALDDDLTTICLKCLEKDSTRRYRTAEALAEDLEHWLRGEPIEARPVRRIGRLWRWCRREPQLASVTVGLFLFMAASTLLTLALYYGERERVSNAEVEQKRQEAALFNRIDREWKENGRAGVRIYAEELALLNRRALSVAGNETRIILAVHSPQPDSNPLQIVQRYAPLANCMQTNRGGPAGFALVFDLRIYNSVSNLLAGVLRDEAHVAMLSPASYGELRRLKYEVTPLIRLLAATEEGQIRAVIFCTTNSGLQSVEALKGKSLVFGYTDVPLFSAWVKADLWAAGLAARDFLCISNLPRSRVVTTVHSGQFDAGVAELKEIELHIKRNVPLRILKEIVTPGYLWTGTQTLSPEMRSVIRERFVAIHDREVLAALPGEIKGFERVGSGDFDSLEAVLERAAMFDQGGTNGTVAQPATGN